MDIGRPANNVDKTRVRFSKVKMSSTNPIITPSVEASISPNSFLSSKKGNIPASIKADNIPKKKAKPPNLGTKGLSGLWRSIPVRLFSLAELIIHGVRKYVTKKEREKEVKNMAVNIFIFLW